MCHLSMTEYLDTHNDGTPFLAGGGRVGGTIFLEYFCLQRGTSKGFYPYEIGNSAGRIRRPLGTFLGVFVSVLQIYIVRAYLA